MVPTFLALFIALLAVSAPVSGRPMVTRRGYYKQLRQEPVQLQSFVEVVGSFPEISVLLEGNQRFRDSIASSSNPNLLQEQTDAGQSPGFLFLGCSDSRVSEGTIFSAAPGTLFTERNIANRFVSNDINSVSVLSYAISELGVDHVIVMGHYGCGGVGAAILPRPTDNSSYAGDAVQNWIEPIRNLFQTSPRPEIAKLREFNAANNVTEEPEFEDPGYRALVEEMSRSPFVTSLMTQSCKLIGTLSIWNNKAAIVLPLAGNGPVAKVVPSNPCSFMDSCMTFLMVRFLISVFPLAPRAFLSGTPLVLS